MPQRLKQKFKINLREGHPYRHWNNLIVEKSSQEPYHSPIIWFNWGMWVTDGKAYAIMFHEELEPYKGKTAVGQRVGE